MAQKSVLGKGLASLFPNATPTPNAGANPSPGAEAPKAPPPSPPKKDPPSGATAAGPPIVDKGAIEKEIAENKERHPGISVVATEDLKPNPFQPRRSMNDLPLEELTESIKANGIIQPLIVRKTREGYQLIAGERRWRAAQKAGLKQVPIVIRRTTDREALELAIIENVQRDDLNCIDEALAYTQLIQDFSLTQEEVAKRVGKDRATISNSIRLLKLPEAIILDLKRDTISLGHGKALLSLESSDQQRKLHKEVIEKKLSVRQVEARVKEIKEGKPAGSSQEKGSLTPMEQRFLTIAKDLTHHYSTKVECKGSDRKGKIIFHYRTREDLDRILAALQN